MQRSIIDSHIRRSEDNTAVRPAVCLWGCVVASHGVTTVIIQYYQRALDIRQQIPRWLESAG